MYAREGLFVLATTAALTAFAILDGEPPWPELPLLAGASLAAALPLTLRVRFPLAGALLSAAIALLELAIPVGLKNRMRCLTCRFSGGVSRLFDQLAIWYSLMRPPRMALELPRFDRHIRACDYAAA
ncbi:hypothetical protein MF672_001230 [Actinomadura sp. ATCC 31491]|uniref:Uncharacterized protein n=1 Tax=Actinomadura luzonensis TaxID=2805427 RepID=A0ABT0FJH6_9ACTN|nr:hypothetical protein [Actinomadura luzonensis]MCK2212429.1 hypothetical protein [Actinomadura luzonensis]